LSAYIIAIYRSKAKILTVLVQYWPKFSETTPSLDIRISFRWFIPVLKSGIWQPESDVFICKLPAPLEHAFFMLKIQCWGVLEYLGHALSENILKLSPVIVISYHN
jgi:hypothetical protein